MIVLLGIVLYEFKTTSTEYQHLLSVTVKNSITLLEAEDDFHLGLSELRGYIITRDAARVASTETALQKADEQIAVFAEHAVNPDSKARGEELRKAVRDYTEHTKEIIALYGRGDVEAATAASAELRKKTDEIDGLFSKAAEVQASVQDAQMADLNDNVNHIFIIVLAVSVIGIIAVGAAAAWFARRLARRLSNLRGDVGKLGKLDLSFQGTRATWNDEIGDMANELLEMKDALHNIVRSIQTEADALSQASDSLSTSVQSQMQVSESIAHTITDVASDAVHNNNSISEISNAIEQVSARTEEMSASGTHVNQTAVEAVEDANNGMTFIQQLVQQNTTVSDSMTEISRVSEKLVTGSDAIKNVVTTIREIAGQTNLLALNAAIEAARVRKLAEQSSAATNEIEQTITQMIDSIQLAAGAITNAEEKVEASKEVTVETEKSFASIQKRLNDVRTNIEQISQAVDHTANDMQDVVGNVQNISAVAEKTGANAETVAAASEEQSASLHDVSDSAEALSQTASKLNDITSKFRL